MSSETTMMTEQCRLQEWAAQIRDFQIVSYQKPGKDEVR